MDDRDIKSDLEILLSHLEHFKYLEPARVIRLRKYILNEHEAEVPAMSLERFFRTHPNTVGVCPQGCSKYSKQDKEIGMNHCCICGEEIVWKKGRCR